MLILTYVRTLNGDIFIDFIFYNIFHKNFYFCLYKR